MRFDWNGFLHVSFLLYRFSSPNTWNVTWKWFWQLVQTNGYHAIVNLEIDSTSIWRSAECLSPTILETLFKRYWYIVAWQASFVRSTILSFISCRKGVDAFVINATFIVDRFSMIRALCFGFNASLIDRTNCNDFISFVRFGSAWLDLTLALEIIYIERKKLTSAASSTLYKDRYSER